MTQFDIFIRFDASITIGLKVSGSETEKEHS